MLRGQQHSVTVIEQDPELARSLSDFLDIDVICGSASRSSIQFSAQVGTMDLVLALTGNDEVNIISASMGKMMGARRCAARVYASIFFDQSTFDYQHHFRIDRMMSVEQLTAMELARHIREPGAMLIEHFARGELEMQDIAISTVSQATGKKLCDLKLPSDVRIAAINRDNKVCIASANDVIQPGDRVSLFGVPESVTAVKKIFHTALRHAQWVVIGGCGETGFHLAHILQQRGYRVTIMERNRDRCNAVTSKLPRCSIVHTDARKRTNLEAERVADADVFVSCMGEDEDNLLSCVEASEVGTKVIIASLDRPDYSNIIDRLGITTAVSSRTVIGRQVQTMLNTGPIITRNSQLFSRGIDVVELEVFADSAITNDSLRNVKLPPQCLIAAVIRGGIVQVPNADYRFKAGDAAITLVHSEHVQDLTKVFSV
jgi:trk system potassium uptake protein TrkA